MILKKKVEKLLPAEAVLYIRRIDPEEQRKRIMEYMKNNSRIKMYSEIVNEMIQAVSEGIIKDGEITVI